MNRKPNSAAHGLPAPEILSDLQKQVQRRVGGRVLNFRLSLRGDGLVLRGHAHTYHAKQLAQHAVMEAIDLPIRANEIEVMRACSAGSSE